jgi:hypothetical protein
MLSEALQRATRHSSTVNEGISLKYIEGTDICITFRYFGVSRHLDRHQIEFWMAALIRMCRRLTGLRLLPTRVRLTHHRDNTSSEFAEFFGMTLTAQPLMKPHSRHLSNRCPSSARIPT